MYGGNKYPKKINTKKSLIPGFWSFCSHTVVKTLTGLGRAEVSQLLSLTIVALHQAVQRCPQGSILQRLSIG